ncbi:MAG TPA: C39 family peptidase, partial [Bacilli bacterium]|nr:C39 family peptidase [Bacilli bacterium]
WSDYLSYQPWGLGLQNKGKDQTSSNNVAKLDDDIIVINNGKASAFQFKVVLRRNNLTSPSPKVSLVCVTLEIPNYEYPIEADLPDFIDYDVPKLNQNIVPQIGNSICSPTSITMLLKYKGHSFIQYDEFEHRYIANLAKDYGNNIFGNWVYNTVTASAFGHDAYVKRMYSFEELMYHLQTVGPVAASVKGNMQGLYTTNGHLLVVRGYRITPTITTVIVNDPNLKDVYFEYNLDVFLNVWRNIVYVIE